MQGLYSSLVIPDLWQQKAMGALKSGKDVVLQAPTGSGKTLVFEHWFATARKTGQVVYTVPTRALANDKCAEWRAKGWQVGISTGDIAQNLDAPLIVATLETQKPRILSGNGPAMMVIDEYQLIADETRGVNYELTIALAPKNTQLLLMSGSVANPGEVASWLGRLGRNAELVEHHERAVPLEEIILEELEVRIPDEVHGFWGPKICAALEADLGPILIFAPRRQAAENLAIELARSLPLPQPLSLSQEQNFLAGEKMAKLLQKRIAYHHSGLSYAVRAGLIEPLTKAGQLRVVVATMGLAAGVNFSTRSVIVADQTYYVGNTIRKVESDELLQMFGRAGRRGLDERGFILAVPDRPRLNDARPKMIQRSRVLDWPTLISVMHYAHQQGNSPYHSAMDLQKNLFATHVIPVGVERSIQHPERACGLLIDAARTRHTRTLIEELQNSRGEWQKMPKSQLVPLGKAFVRTREGQTIPALASPDEIRSLGFGELVEIAEKEGFKIYGKEIQIAMAGSQPNMVKLAKWVRRLLLVDKQPHELASEFTEKYFVSGILNQVSRGLKTKGWRLIKAIKKEQDWFGHFSFETLEQECCVDSHLNALYRFPTRKIPPVECSRCPEYRACSTSSAAASPAFIWRQLGLVDARGVPTRRGRIFSFFQLGEGLAVSAGLEDPHYALEQLLYDLANIRAGYRFAKDEPRRMGRLAEACRRFYGRIDIEGYLEEGTPLEYGYGAAEVVQSVIRKPSDRRLWISQEIQNGDIDRAIIEWRSLLRHLAHAPDLEWSRWRELKTMAEAMLTSTTSPTITDLPSLSQAQKERVTHRFYSGRD